MFKRILSLGLVATLGIAMLTAQAFASNGHFGYIQGYFDVTELNDNGEDVRKVSFELADCRGETHEFHFRQTSDLDVWVNKVNSHMDINQFLNVGVNSTGMVTVMATIGGDCDAIGSRLHDENDSDGNDDSDDRDLDDILEVYRGAEDLPDGHVLSPRPDNFEDKVRVNDRRDVDNASARSGHRAIKYNFQKKIKRDFNDDDREIMDTRLRDMLRRNLMEELKEEGTVSQRHLQELKKNAKKRAHREKRDERVEELEQEFGFEHVNPLRLDSRGSDHVNGETVTLRGMYKSKDDMHVLVNADGEIFAKLDVQDKDFSEFVDKKVFIKGIGFRSEKRVAVSSMRTLNKNESDRNNAQMQFRIGASLYNDVDSNDRELWYAQYLGDLYDDGVITGYEDGSFGGANPVTIAEIAKMSAESADHEVDTRGESRLKAKYKSHWGKFYLKHAEDFNLLPEVDNPDRPATRVEVLEAILRAYGVDPTEEGDLPDAFPDTKDEFIRKAFKLGIVKGFDDGTFRPHAHTNRAEVAKMMTLAAQLLGGVDASDEVVEDLFEEIEGLNEVELEGWVEYEGEVETSQ